MGKTPKSKNVNYRSKSHLPTKVVQRRPKTYGADKLLFPAKSDESAPAKRRMNMSGSNSRKNSQDKSLSIKVKKPSSSFTEEFRHTKEMSVAAVEVSEPINSEPLSIIIFENGKEDSHENEEKRAKESVSFSNGSDPELMKGTKPVEELNVEINKEIAGSNSNQNNIADEEGSSSQKTNKDDDIEAKKQRPGTPQSRSSTPQRKSGRMRSKQDSPSKTSSAANSSPALKILKLNLSPCKVPANGTTLVDKDTTEDKMKSRESKKKQTEKKEDDSHTQKDANDDQILVKEECSESPSVANKEEIKAQAGTVPLYLRSLKSISGRRSLTNRSSPSTSCSYESGNVSTMQWKKKQSRKKDGSFTKYEAEYEYRETENEFNSSALSGKRKAESDDAQSSMLAESSLKKSKGEEDDLRLFLPDGDDDNCSHERDLGESGYLEAKSEMTKQSSSADYGDEMTEFNDLQEKITKDESFIKDESMDLAYEATESKSFDRVQDRPAASSQSRNKRWCILM